MQPDHHDALRSIEGAELEHACWDAADAPDLIHGLWGVDAEACLWDLFGRIAHPGTR